MICEDRKFYSSKNIVFIFEKKNVRTNWKKAGAFFF